MAPYIKHNKLYVSTIGNLIEHYMLLVFCGLFKMLNQGDDIELHKLYVSS
jgi:hypothetical protein